MCDSELIFFSLLRAGLYGLQPATGELPAQIDWDEIIALAEKHGVLGTIIESVQFLPATLRPSAAIMERMNRFAMGLIHANLVLDRRVGRLVDKLSEHGISGVLLKGQGVARYYRKPEMRQSGDVDFYVGKDIYADAVSVCRSELQDMKLPAGESGLHYEFYSDGVKIELHRLAGAIYGSSRRAAFHQWMEQELEHSESRRILHLGDHDVTIPSIDFDALYVFHHAWYHLITGGIGLRQICDWAMIFQYHSAEIDTELLKDNIRRFGLMQGWKFFAYIAVNHLGVAEDKIPFYEPSQAKKYERLLQKIVAGGNFGFHSKAGMRMREKGHSIVTELGKMRSLGEFFVNLFPIIPRQATAIFMNRLLTGAGLIIKRGFRK